ncbi:hypothetical protein [Estrella lausannensis]|nr:hypothetical protein [Estrella lausannensis]
MADEYFKERVTSEISLILAHAKAVIALCQEMKTRESTDVLFNLKSLKILTLKDHSWWSKVTRLFKTRVLRDAIEGESAVSLNVIQFRKRALDLVYSIQEMLSQNPDTPSVLDAMQKAFAAIEELSQQIKEVIESSLLRDKEDLLKKVREMDFLIGKEKGRNLSPLLYYTELDDAWRKAVEARRQDIFLRNFHEKSQFLQESGRTLAMMVRGKKKVGRWATALDIDGKSSLFQESAEIILQNELKELKKQSPAAYQKRLEEEWKLLAAYLRGLKNPVESEEMLESLRRAFSYRQLEVYGDEGLQDLIRWIGSEKEEAAARFRLLRKRWVEKRQKTDAVRRRLERLQEASEETPLFPKESVEIPLLPEGVLPEVNTKLSKLLKTLKALESLDSYRHEWNKARSIRKNLVEQGLIDPTFEEIRKEDSLFGDPALLKHCRDIEEALASEIAKRQKDLLDISQMMESYRDRVENRQEIERLKRSLEEMKKLHGRNFVRTLLEKSQKRRSIFEEARKEAAENEPPSPVAPESQSITHFEECKSLVESLVRTLKIDKSPLYTTQEDLLEAFGILSKPYMTEGTQGKLPKDIARLKVEVESAINSLEVMQKSPLFGLAREKDRIRALIKSLSAPAEPLLLIRTFLQSHHDERLKEQEIRRLLKEKKRFEEELARTEEDMTAAEKELCVLEGILAVEIELGIFLS